MTTSLRFARQVPFWSMWYFPFTVGSTWFRVYHPGGCNSACFCDWNSLNFGAPREQIARQRQEVPSGGGFGWFGVGLFLILSWIGQGKLSLGPCWKNWYGNTSFVLTIPFCLGSIQDGWSIEKAHFPGARHPNFLWPWRTQSGSGGWSSKLAIHFQHFFG